MGDKLRAGTTIGGYLALHSGLKEAYLSGNLTVKDTIKANVVEGAVYNDYAEYRLSKENIEAGRVVTEVGNGYVKLCNKRLSKCPMIVSDTFGFSIGKINKQGDYSLPIAVAGRVLAYTDKPKNKFKVGDVVCSGKNGTVSKMRWWEKILFPDRILGVVSEIPNYEIWGSNKIKVNNRIWIKVI